MKTAVYGCGITGEAAARLSIELGDETAVLTIIWQLQKNYLKSWE